MRYLVLSDIHANDVALEAVLRHGESARWDRVIFLGDVVGYYPEVERTTTLLRDLEPEVAILGNHDALLLSLLDAPLGRGSREGGLVADIVAKHKQALSPENVAFIRGFQKRVLRENWEATHGALREPWEYLSSLNAAQANFPFLERDLCLVGHTHIPVAYAGAGAPGHEVWRALPFRGERAVYRLPPKARVFFNPGSVGQPRDGVPLASYAVFDEEARVLELYRVAFDIERVQQAVRSHGYPEALATRLSAGR